MEAKSKCVLSPRFYGAKPWGSPEEVERRNRIRVSAWAFAYEVEDNPIASDEAFDALAKLINPTATTGHPQLDAFFASEFSTDTGMWVRNHPDKVGLRLVCQRMRGKPWTKSRRSAPIATATSTRGASTTSVSPAPRS